MNKNIIHEITNYLHHIISNAEYIQNSSEFSHYAEEIKKSAYRIDALMTDGTVKKTELTISKSGLETIDIESLVGKNVMIVDDLEDNIHIMKNIFNTFSCNINCAYSGEEALALFQSGFVPDIVCMDIIMPGIDGVTTTKELKLLGCNAYFIAISALKNQSHQDVSIFDIWLPKPFMLDHILGALSEYNSKSTKADVENSSKFQLDISDEIKKEILALAQEGAYSALEQFLRGLPDSQSKDFFYAALKRVDFNLIINTIISS